MGWAFLPSLFADPSPAKHEEYLWVEICAGGSRRSQRCARRPSYSGSTQQSGLPYFPRRKSNSRCEKHATKSFSSDHCISTTAGHHGEHSTLSKVLFLGTAARQIVCGTCNPCDVQSKDKPRPWQIYRLQRVSRYQLGQPRMRYYSYLHMQDPISRDMP